MAYPDYSGLAYFGNGGGAPPEVRWGSVEEDTVGPLPDFPPITLPDVTLNVADVLTGLGMDPADVPVTPWIAPPTGTPVADVSLFDLDPHPDYYTLRFGAGMGVLSGYLAGEESVNEDAGLTYNLSEGTTPATIISSGSPWVTNKAVGGWWLPDTHTLDPTVTFESGDEGTDLLWPWGTFPTLDATFPGSWGAAEYSVSLLVTPYWLLERGVVAGNFMCVL